MNIVVTTPTGHIGSRVVELLTQVGVRPTVLARDPARLPEAVRAAADVRQGDLGDADFVRKATAGADALFYLIPTNYGADDPVAEIRRLGGIAADAVRANGVARTVFLSSIGAHRKGERDPIGALGRVEEVLNEAAANVTHLRAGHFYTNLLMDADSLRRGVLPTTFPVERPTPWNDPKDVGTVAAARLLAPDWAGHTVLALEGPEPLSFARVAEIVSEATGIPVAAVAVTDEQSRAGMVAAGLPPAAADALVEMGKGIREIADFADDGRAATLTLPTPLAAWCYATLRPALRRAPAPA